MSQFSWWKGIHGEWYVVAQVVLVVLVFFGPTNLPAWPVWNPPFTWLGWIGGGILLSTGCPGYFSYPQVIIV
jgi:hypothetical protein